MKSAFSIFIYLFLYCTIITPQAKAPDKSSIEMSKSNTLFIGCGIPIGDFGSNSATIKEAGFALSGLSFAYEMANPENTIPGMLTLGVALNPIDEESLTKINQTQFPNNHVTLSTGSYVNVTSMLGLQLETSVIPEIKLYGLAQGGVLFSYMPDWEIKVDNNSATQTFQISTSFAYEFGAGAKIYNTFNIGIRYLAANTEYVTTINENEFKMPLSTSILQIMAGIMF